MSLVSSVKRVLFLILVLCSIVACDDDNGSTDSAGTEMAGTEMAGTEMAGTEMSSEMTPEETAQLAFDWLTGRFDSSAQSIAQPSYFAIQLLACKVEAPEIGEHVLYIEQAQVEAADMPYRQRLYHVEPVLGENGELEVVSNVYSLNDPDAVVGLCDQLDRPTFAPSDVSLREGCSVYLKWNEDHFEGGTKGQDCSSTLGGASYATSEVTMTATEIHSWDRGFDSSDAQVWGAEDGAYEFIRQE